MASPPAALRQVASIMSLTQKILRGSTLNLLDHGVRTAALLVVTPVMISGLGMESYGVWLVLTAAVSFLNLLDGGITLSGTRYLARALGEKNGAENYVRTAGTLSWLYRWIGVGCLMVTGILVLAVPWVVKNAEWTGTGRMVIAVLGVSMALRFFLRIHLVVLKSHVRYDLIVAASLVKVVLQSVLVVVLLRNGHGLLVLALAQITSDLVDQFLIVMFSHKTGDPRTLRANPCPELLPDILRYSVLAFLNTTGQQLRSGIGPFVISGFVGVARVPVFNMGLRLMTMFFDVVNAIMGGTLLAGFSQVEGRSGVEGVREKYLLSLRFSTALAILGATGLFSLGPAFLERWLGMDFTESGTVLRLLVLPHALWLMQFPAGSLFLSLNKHQVITWLTFIAGVVNVLLSILLASRVGFYGVVWASFADLTAFYGLVVPVLVSRALHMPLARYYRLLLTPAVKLGAILGLGAWLLSPLAVPDYGRITLSAGLICALFAVAAVFVMLSAAERAALLARWRSRHTKKAPGNS